MLEKLIGLGILTAHFINYKEYYWKIFRTFSSVFIVKTLVKISGDKDNSDLIRLGGYSLTACEVINLISAVKQNGNKALKDETKQEVVGGLLGGGIDKIMELLGK